MAALTSRRPPVAVLPTNDGVCTTLSRSACFSWARVAVGCVDRIRARAPVTWGVAMEVPL